MATAKLKQVSPAPTIGALIDKMKSIAIQRTELSAQDKALKSEQDELESQIIALMDKQDTRVGEGKIARASIVESEEPHIEDWDKFLTWTKRTGNMHLIQRRISAPAWREIRELKKAEVPGTTVFKKRSLNLRAVSAK